MNKVLYIVNPTSNGGMGIKVWKRFIALSSTTVSSKDVHFTTHSNHARELAQTAKGYELVVAVGGDGTVGEVISGIMANNNPENRPALAVLPAGTGNDIARHVGAFPLQQAISTLQGGEHKTYDLIGIECRGDDGPLHRYAFLYATAGFSALVKFKPWMKRYLGPAIGTYLSMILALLDFRPPKMTVSWDGDSYTGPLWMAIAANAESVAGGSIRLAPGSKTDDGKLDLLLIPAKSKPAMLATVLPKIPTGRHIDVAGVQYFQCNTMNVDADRPMLVEVDGDVFGYTPALFSLYPKVLNILSA